MMQQKKDFSNIIMVSKDSIVLKKEDGALEIALSDKLDFYDIVKMNIEVLKDTSLLICYSKSKEIKIDIRVTVNPHVSFSLFEEKKAKNTKIQTKFFLYENTNTHVSKFYDGGWTRELTLFYLNGEGAQIHSSVKGIFKNTSTLDLLVYHHFPKTKSQIENKLVTIEKGMVKLHVTTMIYNKIKGCVAKQNSTIIKQNEKESIIKPILLIEENDVEASHSAIMGTVDSQMLYYMKTRGFTEAQAKKLYMKGFLKGDFYNIDAYIKKYWR